MACLVRTVVSIAFLAWIVHQLSEAGWSTCNRVKGYEAVSLSAPTMDDRLHIMLNGRTLETWDPPPAAETWFTGNKR